MYQETTGPGQPTSRPEREIAPHPTPSSLGEHSGLCFAIGGGDGRSETAGLHLIKGFHDERLQGEWEGHRSSRLNAQYRVIYKVEEHLIQVVVMDVTAHDYRRQS